MFPGKEPYKFDFKDAYLIKFVYKPLSSFEGNVAKVFLQLKKDIFFVTFLMITSLKIKK